MPQSENKLSPCMMVRKPPIDDISYRTLSFEEGTSDDDKGCISFEDFKSKAKETKEELKRSLGLEGSLREGIAQNIMLLRLVIQLKHSLQNNCVLQHYN